MTVGAWLRERAPAPPELTARIAEVTSARLDAASDAAAGIFLEAAEQLLEELIARSSGGRELALDLLTVDALTTYAFEAASAIPESVPARASDAMRRFARIAVA